MASAVIKIIDVPQPEGAIDVQVEFCPAIDNNSPAHQFVERVVTYLQEGNTEADRSKAESQTGTDNGVAIGG